MTSENVIAELDGRGNVQARYATTREQDDVIVKQNLALNRTAIYSDFNDNLPTQTVRDEFGNVIETLQTPDPYGTMQTSSSLDHTRFEGKMQDPVTGLFYFRNRWYDAQARRFISRDEKEPSILNPKTTNAYAAFDGDPIRFRDPTGWGTSWVTDPYIDYVQRPPSTFERDIYMRVAYGGGDEEDLNTFNELNRLREEQRQLRRQFGWEQGVIPKH